MCDMEGLLTKSRNSKELQGNRGKYAKDLKPTKNLEEIVNEIKPTVSGFYFKKFKLSSIYTYRF